MKSFTIAFALAVAFAACGSAAPQEPAPVYNYDPLVAELGRVAVAYPASKQYVETLDKDIEAQKQAVISGDKAKMSRTVRKGAKETKAGSHSVESNAKLYQLANKQAPNALEDLAAGFAKDTKTAADENDLMGQFEKLVEAALAQ